MATRLTLRSLEHKKRKVSNVYENILKMFGAHTPYFSINHNFMKLTTDLSVICNHLVN